MNRFKRRRTTLGLAFTALLAVPLALAAFVLVELQVDLDLDLPAGEDEVFNYQLIGPKTGFTLHNPSNTATLSFVGSTSFNISPPPDAEAVQEGFLLLDGSLAVELAVTANTGGREIARTTYRRDVRGRALSREAIARRLIARGFLDCEVPQEPQDICSEALVRAGSMGLRDARVMRFVEGNPDSGRESRWKRAVRVLVPRRDGVRFLLTESQASRIGPDDIRFLPRTEPDGTLGHYGTALTSNQEPYVWAVLDRNARTAVGLTVDRDNDGVVNAQDNCVGTVNPDQTNTDRPPGSAEGDDAGDACDLDDDDDQVPDEIDNCPLTVNADQIDADGNGIGDVCDSDLDADGVIDGLDDCQDTAAGALVAPDGCSIEDLCPCDSGWRNHGAYVRCVAHESEDFLELGLITEEEKDATVSAGAQSSCGF